MMTRCVYDRFFTYQEAALVASQVAELCCCSISVRPALSSFEVLVPQGLYYSEWFLREVAEPDLIDITPQGEAHVAIH